MSAREPSIHRRTDGQADRAVVSREQIARRVDELAHEIAEGYAGEELIVLAVLLGSFVFVADLIRRLPMAVKLEAAWLESYPGRATESKGPRVLLPAQPTWAGGHVLVVDEIMDSGQTLQTVLAMAKAAKPASLRSCVLLRKTRPDLPHRPQPDFVGFDVKRQFLVGYGLDFDGKYRNLPDIHVLSQHVPGRDAEVKDYVSGG